jgi:hypothetical protein
VDDNLSPVFQTHFHLSPHVADVIAVVCFVIPLAALTIVIGELIPKVLAIKNAEFVCLALSPLMWAFSLVVYPAVLLFEWLTKAIVRAIESVLPGDNVYDNFVFVPRDIKPGIYDLQVSIIDAVKGVPKVKLAIEGMDKEGWYMLGKTEIVD